MSMSPGPHQRLQAAKLRTTHRHSSGADHLPLALSLLVLLQLSAGPGAATLQQGECRILERTPSPTPQLQGRAGVSLLITWSALQSVQEGSLALQEVPEAGKVLLWEQQRDHLLKHLSRAQTRAALRRMSAISRLLLLT